MHLYIFCFYLILHIAMFICHEGSVFFGKEDTSLAQVLGKMLYKYFQLPLSVGVGHSTFIFKMPEICSIRFKSGSILAQLTVLGEIWVSVYCQRAFFFQFLDFFPLLKCSYIFAKVLWLIIMLQSSSSGELLETNLVSWYFGKATGTHGAIYKCHLFNTTTTSIL